MVVLAVGSDFSGEIMSSIMLPLLLFFGSLGAAIVIAFITYRNRSEAAKRADEEERRIRGL
jgi:cell division protein FtsL